MIKRTFVLKAKNKAGKVLSGIFPGSTTHKDVARWLFSSLGNDAKVIDVVVVCR